MPKVLEEIRAKGVIPTVREKVEQIRTTGVLPTVRTKVEEIVTRVKERAGATTEGGILTKESGIVGGGSSKKKVRGI